MSAISEKLNEIGYKPLVETNRNASPVTANLLGIVNYPVPEDYLNFLSEFPETGIFDADVVCSGIESAPCAPDALYPISLLYGHCPTESYDLLNIRKNQNETPMYLLIIGEDDGGNYFCLDLRSESFGKVYFVFHEEDIESGLYLLADSFTPFVNGLRKTA